MIDSNYDQSRVIAQIGANNETTWYTYGKGLIGQEDETGYLTYHFDTRGSTTAVKQATKAGVKSTTDIVGSAVGNKFSKML